VRRFNSGIKKILLHLYLTGESDCVVVLDSFQNEQTYKPTSFRLMGIYILRFLCFLFVGQTNRDQTSGLGHTIANRSYFLATHYPVDFPEPRSYTCWEKNNFKMKEVFTQMQENVRRYFINPAWKAPTTSLSFTINDHGCTTVEK
jgi:hypothetical protein